MADKKKIAKQNWVSRFSLTGESVVNDYTFKLNQHSEKSSWCYNSMSLMVDCGEKYGNIAASMMGGFSEDGKNVIYCHGKNEDGSDDFKTQITVDWDDRFNEELHEQIGDMCFIKVELEKTSKGKNFEKKFLSAYDAIEYIHDHLESGMVIYVDGTLRYSMYNDTVQCQKNITRILLSNVDDKSKYGAHFVQSVLIDKDSVSLKEADKNKSVLYVHGRVLDYAKEINDVEIKGQYPFPFLFEYAVDMTKPELVKKIYSKLFNIKKDVNQITFDGDIIESGATTTMTVDDLPEDIKDLIEYGVYTEEQALAECATGGSRERRMVLIKPKINKVTGDDGVVTNVPQIFEGRYEEEDLTFDVPADDPPFEVESDDDWLNDL